MGGRRAARRVRGRDLRRVGGVPAFHPLRRRDAGAARAGGRGIKVGLISNSHRCLASFQQHFELHGLIAARAVVVRAWLPEAAPEHLRGGAEAAGRVGRRVGDGGRQPAARHRGRATRRHARRARSADPPAARRATRLPDVVGALRRPDPKLSAQLALSLTALSRRPGEAAAREQVQMDVKDRLPCLAVAC